MKRRASLQLRLLLMVTTAVLVAWAASAAMTAIDAREEVDELLDAHLAQAAALLVARSAGEIEGEHRIETPALHRYAPRVAFRVLHEGRLVLASTQIPPWPAQADARGFRTERAQGKAWRVFSARGAEHDVLVEVGERVEARVDIVEAIVRSMLWPLAFIVPLLVLAVWWSVRSGLAPLRELGSELHDRSAADLRPLSTKDVPAEIAPLAQALDALFGRIEALLVSERRFTSDAAHELRTPIAAIRAQAQVALGSSDDASRRRALESTITACDRATRVVEQLLTLSRLEAQAAPPLHRVDLGRVVREQLAALAAAALREDRELQLDAAPDCFITGEEALVAVLVRNLVDNALRYTEPFDEIAVTISPGSDSIELVVEDSGPGLPEEMRGRLGERFFRPPGSKGTGSGLGWSIVRRIADVHRASVACDASPRLGGLRVTVRWPRA